MARKKQEEIIISIQDKNDLKYWCEELKCNKEDLVEALSRVGDSFRAVSDYLSMNNKIKSEQ